MTLILDDSPAATRACPGCRRVLPPKAFGINTSKRHGRQEYCLTCNRLMTNAYHPHRARDLHALSPATIERLAALSPLDLHALYLQEAGIPAGEERLWKWCPGCQRHLRLTDFPLNKRGPAANCRQCVEGVTARPLDRQALPLVPAEPSPTLPPSPTKPCTRCQRELPLDQYAPHYKTADGHYTICKRCQIVQYGASHGKEGAVVPALIPAGHKWCTACWSLKPLTEYYTLTRTGETVAHCKTCQSQAAAVYYAHKRQADTPAGARPPAAPAPASPPSAPASPPAAPAPTSPPAAPMETKWCGRCQTDKPVSDFYRSKDGTLIDRCKSCRKLANTTYRQRLRGGSAPTTEERPLLDMSIQAPIGERICRVCGNPFQPMEDSDTTCLWCVGRQSPAVEEPALEEGRRPYNDNEQAIALRTGIRVYDLRQHFKLSTRRFAEKCGLHYLTIDHLEAGTSLPQETTLRKIAEATGCTLDYLVGKNKAMFPPTARIIKVHPKAEQTAQALANLQPIDGFPADPAPDIPRSDSPLIAALAQGAPSPRPPVESAPDAEKVKRLFKEVHKAAPSRFSALAEAERLAKAGRHPNQLAGQTPPEEPPAEPVTAVPPDRTAHPEEALPARVSRPPAVVEGKVTRFCQQSSCRAAFTPTHAEQVLCPACEERLVARATGQSGAKGMAGTGAILTPAQQAKATSGSRGRLLRLPTGELQYRDGTGLRLLIERVEVVQEHHAAQNSHTVKRVDVTTMGGRYFTLEGQAAKDFLAIYDAVCLGDWEKYHV